MRIRAGIVACAVAVLVAVAVPAPAGAAVTRQCGQISFTPDSDDGIFDVRARGVGCRTARRVARAARPLKIVGGSRRYSSRGFTCRGTFDDEGLPTVRWRCTRGSAVVRFERS